MPSPRTKNAPPPQTFAPGARMEIRGEEWIVRKAEQTSTGDTAVHVTGLSELVRNKNAIFLTDLDREMRVLQPEETELVADPSPGYRRSRLYLESLLRSSPPTDSRIYRGHRGAMDAADYQLVPAGKALSQPRPRILIADAVGLGKTVEVGILLSELIRRGRGRRILVVALKSVLEQFQEELWARFSIPLVRLDSVGLERVQRQIPANHNPFYHFDRVIISVDTLKKDEKYRRFLEACQWDAVVVDECQHVAVRTQPGSHRRSQRAKLAELLARTSDALILTSATPHDGKKESFASLMNLLEPTAIADEQDYTAEDVQGLFVRRFKRHVQGQVKGAFSERVLQAHRIDVSAEENAVFEQLKTATFRTIQPRSRSGGVLFRTLLLKSFLSSPEALRETLQARLKHKRLRPPAEAPEAPLDDDAQADVDLLQALDATAAKVTTKRNAKLQQLIGLLAELGVTAKGQERVVIFSERIATLSLLQAQLTNALKLKPGQVDVFHGSLDDQKQQRLVKEFGSEKSEVRILLASDAASEGINLHHFCHRMVHYDIPWSLITLEQRNGRIDRYGQEHQPQLHYLLSVPDDEEVRGDLRVLDVLIDKENVAHKNLGDARWLMNLHDAEAEAERIAEGISQHEDPEQIIPDAPEEQDFLAILMGMGDSSSAQTELWQSDLLNASPDSTTPPETCEPLRLFPGDLEFAREAFSELLASQPQTLSPEARLSEPQWEEGIAGFVLQAPADLQQRYRLLPPELQRGKDWRFKLTTDRDLVQQALAESRQDADAWPEYELFWEQHPVADWLGDRMTAHFLRHEAPVIEVQRGLAKGAAAFVFQGVLSNNRSQPMIAEWFVVIINPAANDPKRRVVRQPLSEWMPLVGLDQPLVNTGTKIAVEPLHALRQEAVESAQDHMDQARAKRRDRLNPVLKESGQKLRAWEKRKRAELEARREKATTGGKALRADIAQRLRAQEQEIDHQIAARDKWLKQTLSTLKLPYLRIGAVLVAAKGGK